MLWVIFLPFIFLWVTQAFGYSKPICQNPFEFENRQSNLTRFMSNN
jgi:hypothetical protein